MIDDGVPSKPGQAEPDVHLDGLKPTMTISIARMNRFTKKVYELGA
jgi:hypothetical protein